jgi:hypothetical protein
MIDNEIPSNNILAWHDIYYVEPLQITIATREDNVKDVNDDDISMKMNKQVPLEELCPPRARLNYD